MADKQLEKKPIEDKTLDKVNAGQGAEGDYIILNTGAGTKKTEHNPPTTVPGRIEPM